MNEAAVTPEFERIHDDIKELYEKHSRLSSTVTEISTTFSVYCQNFVKLEQNINEIKDLIADMRTPKKEHFEREQQLKEMEKRIKELERFKNDSKKWIDKVANTSSFFGWLVKHPKIVLWVIGGLLLLAFMIEPPAGYTLPFGLSINK